MTIGRIYGLYKNLLCTHTYKVQAVQTGFLLGVGDLISQNLIETAEDPHDYRRTVRFVAIGFVIGPVIQKWYLILDRFVGKEQNFKTLLKKIALDQGIMAPSMLGTFLTTITLMEGGGYESIRARLKKDYIDILTNNYKVWPLVQVITFSLPVNFRVLFVQVVSLGWNTYLAWKINHKNLSA